MEKYDELHKVMTEHPDGEEKLQILEEWIAEANNDKNYGWEYELRMNQNEVAVNVGRYDLLMDNFSWCLDVFEQNPGKFEDDVLLWQFKWFLEFIHYFPRVSNDEIEEYYAYYKKLLKENNYTLRSYYQLRAIFARESGYTKSLPSYREKWLNEERDDMSDCEYCEKKERMKIHFELGELKEGFELGTELINNKFGCESIPHAIYPYLLLPAWNTERVDEAKIWQEQGYFLIRKKPKYLIEVSHMILFLSLVDIRKAYEVFNEHIYMADDMHDLHSRFYFYLAAWCMIEKAKELRFHVNEDVTWFEENVPGLAIDFDTRNGNHFFEETMKEWLSYIE